MVRPVDSIQICTTATALSFRRLTRIHDTYKSNKKGQQKKLPKNIAPFHNFLPL